MTQSTDKELTVKECLAELREFWPGCSAEIIRHSAAGFYKSAQTWFEIAVISVDYKLHGERWTADSLDGCMAQVRTWKESQQ